MAALIIARNLSLRGDQVRDILKRSCDQIDATGGDYDATGHSALYGYGRLNAKKAVELALPAQPTPIIIRTIVQDVPITDLKTSTLTLPIADTDIIKTIKITLDIEHTYIGDLVVTSRRPPASARARSSCTTARAGRSTTSKRPTTR